jgi:hypothetical protein
MRILIRTGLFLEDAKFSPICLKCLIASSFDTTRLPTTVGINTAFPSGVVIVIERTVLIEPSSFFTDGRRFKSMLLGGSGHQITLTVH